MSAETTTQPRAARTLMGRVRDPFEASVGSIVFGMEDGTVSIFGLVFGVAFAAPDSHAVLLAGATRAVAAAVFMMAGTFLDVESTNDQAAARLAEARTHYESDPEADDEAAHRRLVAAGFASPDADTFLQIVGKYPATRLKIEAAVDLGVGDATRQNPVAQSAWMFVTDLVAAAIPVIPFAFLSLARPGSPRC